MPTTEQQLPVYDCPAAQWTSGAVPYTMRAGSAKEALSLLWSVLGTDAPDAVELKQVDGAGLAWWPVYG